MLSTTSAETDGIAVVSKGGQARRRGRRGIIAVFAIACAAVFLSGDIAQAHQWSNYHWRRGGGAVYVYVWNGCGSAYNICEAARSDVHYRPHPIYLINVDYHTDISLLTTSDSSAGWYGLAEIWWDGNYGAPHIGHGHATLNTYYSQGGTTNQQGTMCQEIGHTLGLTHAPTGDCMAKSYYSPWTTKFADSNGYSHPSADLKNMYSTFHH